MPLDQFAYDLFGKPDWINLTTMAKEYKGVLTQDNIEAIQKYRLQIKKIRSEALAFPLAFINDAFSGMPARITDSLLKKYLTVSSIKHLMTTKLYNN